MFTHPTNLTQADLTSAVVRDPLCVAPETTVGEAIAQMSQMRGTCAVVRSPEQRQDEQHIEARSSCVLVIENQQLIGILTERDIVRLSVETGALENLPICEVLTRHVITLQESEFTDIFVALNRLQHHRIRHLPIVDAQNHLVGLVTHETLQQTARPVDLMRLRTVSDVMVSDVITADASASMLETARLMAEHCISCIVLVQESADRPPTSLQMPVGVVTERDLVQFRALALDLTTCPVQRVMSAPVFSVQPEESLWVVHQMMERYFIRRLVVIGSQGELIGIVTQTNLLQVLNPLELYNLTEVLEQKVCRLEAEKVALLKSRATELEQQVEDRTATLQMKANQEKLLLDISTQIRNSLDLQTILDTTVAEVRQVLKCDRVIIFQFHPDFSGKVIAESIQDGGQSFLHSEIHDSCITTECLESYLQGHVRVVRDIHTEAMSPCHQDMLHSLESRSQALVPVLVDQQLWGLIVASHRDQPREWQPSEVEFLQALSVQVGIALKQAITYQTLQTELIERQRAEAALKESEQRFKAIFNSTFQFAGLMTPDGTAIEVNQTTLDFSGVSHAQVVNQPIWELPLWSGNPEHVRRLQAAVQQAAAGEFVRYEVEIQGQGGQTAIIDFSIKPIFDAEGQVVLLVPEGWDITDRKQAEAQRLRMAQTQRELKLLEQVLDVVLAGYWDWDLVNQTEYLSPGFKKMFGYADDELANSPETWKRLMFAEDLPQIWQTFERHVASQGKVPFYNEVRYHHKDGSTVWVICSGQVIEWDESGQPLRMIGCHIDITKRKQAERQRKRQLAAIEAAIDGIAILSADNTYLYLNSAHRNLFGYDDASELIGQPWQRLYSPEEFTRFEQEIFPVLTRDRAWEGEAIATRRDGSTFDEGLSLTLTDDGLLICVCRDITERKRSETLIQQQANREALLLEVTQRIRQSLDLQTIFETACEEIRHALQADRVGIFKFYPDSGCDEGEFVAESMVAGWPSALAVHIHDHCFGKKHAKYYTQGKYYVVNDIHSAGLNPCYSRILDKFGVRANLVYPLLCGSKLWGLLCIHQCAAPRQWQPDEIQLAHKLSDQLAIAIRQAELYEQTQAELESRQQAEAKIAQQLQQQQALGRIGQKIRESLNLNDILATAAEQVKVVLGGDRVIVFRLFPDGRSRIVEEAVSHEFPRLKGRQWEDEVWDQELLEIYWQGQSRIVPDVMDDIWTRCLVDYAIEGQIQSKVVAPILLESRDSEQHRWIAPDNRSKLWGILVIHACQNQRVWDESEAELLQQVANQLAIAIHQSNLFEQLQQELTERQQAQQQLTIANEELLRATRLKDEFLANISHELRTPLNAILGMTEGLQEQVFGEINSRQRKSLDTVERSAYHLLSLINDILDVAKIESGKIELDLAPTAIAPLCKSCLTFIKQQAHQKGIQVEIQRPLSLPQLCIDERRIRQVLINLLNNAVKFTPQGGNVILSVSVEPRPPVDNVQKYVRFAVRDTGIGIAPENIAKLFKPFIQIDSALNRQHQGTGLGLVLVKRIVELHGGQINLTSEVGVGSCFSFDLPYTPTTKTAPRPFISSDSAPETTLESPKLLATPQRILLAEDQEANISTLSSYLNAKGYQVLIARNGEEAIAVAQAEQPDVILIDIQMPGIDGLEAIEHIRRDPTLIKVPIIALTALAMEGDREQCLAAGANEYMSKPVKLRQLVTTIQDLLSQ